jgi:methionyl-tRNA formyltransferase
MVNQTDEVQPEPTLERRTRRQFSSVEKRRLLEGEPTYFRRTTPSDNNLSQANTLKQVFDYIRMLDAAGYPDAYLDTHRHRLAFSDAKIHNNPVVATVAITMNSENKNE